MSTMDTYLVYNTRTGFSGSFDGRGLSAMPV